MSRLYLVPDMQDIERVDALAKRYGCAYEYNEFYVPDVMDDAAEQERIAAHYAKYRDGFAQDTIHGAFLDVTVHSTDRLIREASMLRVRQSMETADRMGVRGVVFHTGRLAGFREPGYLQRWKDVNAAFFRELAAQYPHREIYMENMFDESPDIMAELAEQMRDVANFGICLDYAHAMLTPCPGREWFEALAPYIRHMHINDNDLAHDLHHAVGSGRIDWQEFDALARQYRVDATVLVEVRGYEAQKESLEYMSRNGIYPMGKEERNASAV